MRQDRSKFRIVSDFNGVQASLWKAILGSCLLLFSNRGYRSRFHKVWNALASQCLLGVLWFLLILVPAFLIRMVLLTRRGYQTILRLSLSMIQALILSENATDFIWHLWALLVTVGAFVHGRWLVNCSIHYWPHFDDWRRLGLEQINHVVSVWFATMHRVHTISIEFNIFVNNFWLNYLHIVLIIHLHSLHCLQGQLRLICIPICVGIVVALHLCGGQCVDKCCISIYLFGLLKN